MIEINLYPGKGTGSGEASSIDFNDISKKGMAFAALAYVIVYIVAPYFYNTKLGNWDNKLNEQRQTLASIKSRMGQLKELRREIEAAKQEEKLLYDQLNVIKEVTNDKRNPMRVLLFLARNLPENTWVTKFNVQGRDITIEGRSFSYNLIGKLFNAFEDSVFFSSRPNLTTQSVTSGDTNDTGRRLEEFKITGNVKQFE